MQNKFVNVFLLVVTCYKPYSKPKEQSGLNHLLISGSKVFSMPRIYGSVLKLYVSFIHKDNQIIYNIYWLKE